MTKDNAVVVLTSTSTFVASPCDGTGGGSGVVVVGAQKADSSSTSLIITFS